MVVEREGDGSVPGGLQHRVLEPALLGTVVPLREVGRAVGSLRRGPDLVAVHAAPALDPATARALCWQGSGACSRPPVLGTDCPVQICARGAATDGVGPQRAARQLCVSLLSSVLFARDCECVTGHLCDSSHAQKPQLCSIHTFGECLTRIQSAAEERIDTELAVAPAQSQKTFHFPGK